MAESCSVASAECASLAGPDIILNSKAFEMFQWSYIIYFDHIDVYYLSLKTDEVNSRMLQCE